MGSTNQLNISSKGERIEELEAALENADARIQNLIDKCEEERKAMRNLEARLQVANDIAEAATNQLSEVTDTCELQQAKVRAMGARALHEGAA